MLKTILLLTKNTKLEYLIEMTILFKLALKSTINVNVDYLH